jgi:hypothetical protein
LITFGQLLLAVSIPTVVALVGITFNQVAIYRLTDKIESLRGEMFNEFKEFYRTLGQHEGQIEMLKREGK